MPWFVIRGTPTQVRKGSKDLLGRVTKFVRGARTVIFVEIPPGEEGWLDKITKDLNLSRNLLENTPKYSTAPCGILTTDLAHHRLRCKKCQVLSPTPTKASKPVTVVNIPGITEFSLEGLLSYLKGKLDEALQLAADIEKVIKAIEGVLSLDQSFNKMKQERENHIQALKYFMREKNL